MRTMRAKFQARMVAVLTVAAVALGFLQLAPAGADDTTIVTFSIVPGALSIDAQPTANLGGSTSTGGVTTVSGTLGSISVSDTRSLSVGWIASGASTDFTSGTNTIPKLAVTITQGNEVVSKTTNVTSFVGAAASGAGGPIATAVAVGSNTATFAPTMSVVVPPGTPIGDYTGTFTSTVV